MFAGRYLSIMFLCWYPTLLSVRFLLRPITNMSSAAPRRGGGMLEQLARNAAASWFLFYFWRSYAVASYFLLHFFLLLRFSDFFFIPLFFMYIFVLPEFLNLGECSCCLHILTSYIFLKLFFFFSIFSSRFLFNPLWKLCLHSTVNN